jgi:hypothetical protein
MRDQKLAIHVVAVAYRIVTPATEIHNVIPRRIVDEIAHHLTR